MRNIQTSQEIRGELGTFGLAKACKANSACVMISITLHKAKVTLLMVTEILNLGMNTLKLGCWEKQQYGVGV